MPPQREPAAAEPLPEGVQCPGAASGVTRAKDGAGQDVAGIMHAVVNARESDEAGHGQHETDAAPVVDEANDGGGKPICRVRRGHTAAVRAADASGHVDIGDVEEWTRTGDGLFNGVAYEGIAEGDGQDEHEDTQTSPDTAFPAEQKTNENQDRGKVRVAADKRHDFIKKGVAQRRIDEVEQSDVERLGPLHQRGFMVERRMTIK